MFVLTDDQDQPESTPENPNKNSGRDKKENQSGKSNSALMAEFFQSIRMRIKNKIQEKSDRRGPKFHARVSITSREIQRRWVLIQYSIRLQGQGSDAPYKRIGYCKLY